MRLQGGFRTQTIPGDTPSLVIDADYGKMPLYFIPNMGQMDGQVAYYVQGKDKTLYFTPERITLVMAKAGGRTENSSRLNPKEPIMENLRASLRADDGMKYH